MAKQPIPEQPKLFKNFKGQFVIHYPSVRFTGARTLGSHHLKTMDEDEAQKLMTKWIKDGEYKKAVAEAEARRDAHKKGVRPKPVAARPMPPSTDSEQLPKRKYTKRNGSGGTASSNLAQAREIMSIISGQMHALAKTFQMLSASLGASDE